MKLDRNWDRKMQYKKKEELIFLLKEALHIEEKRTNLQNRALNLFFKNMSDQLNNIGHTAIKEINGVVFEIPFNRNVFLEVYWRDIQEMMYGTRSTTELSRKQIDPILDILTLAFATGGVSVSFPNKFDMILKQMESIN